MSNYDVAIIGGGPGGYVAAIRAAQLGLNSVVIEQDKLGGICLNWGCIPTKALLRSSEVLSLLNHAANFGLSAENIDFDFDKIIARSRKISGQLSNGVAYLMKKNKVSVIHGRGKLLSPSTIEITDANGETLEPVEAKHIILATGARAKNLPGLEIDDEQIWGYRSALAAPKLPSSLLIVGAGAIGVEFASFYNQLGTQVTLIDIADHILPIEDHEISKEAAKLLSKQGINIQTSTSISKYEQAGDGLSVELKKADGEMQTITVDKILSAAGITPNIENIGLEELGIVTERGAIKTDEWCCTNQAGVYAIGDVTMPPWLAHKASHEAIICVEKIAGLPDVHPLNRKALPGCTYSTPQIASVGLTEQMAKEEGVDIKIGRFPFRANGKAIAMGETEGFIKTIADSNTGKLLGAHMIGAEVTELIQGFTIAIHLGATVSQLAHVIFPHPTLSEMMHESILDSEKQALHF